MGKTIPPPLYRRGFQKHPHARGEDYIRNSQVRLHIETPPRTWGRRWGRRHGHLQDGNTPTHVGKTVRGASAPSMARKHPHARGEDYIWNSQVRLYIETPPRTWGRQSSRISGNAERRNTPTHVGKTKSKKVKKSHKRKHPHARGEDYLSVCTVLLMLETPPRTWGRLLYRTSRTKAARNTPTHVGKTDF